MDTVVIARLKHVPPVPESSEGVDDEVLKAKFEIVEVLKGGEHLQGTKTLDIVYFGTGKIGDNYLLMAIDPPKLAWSTATLLSKVARQYLVDMSKLPKRGKERLLFFQNYLECDDKMIAQDAYDEFARAPLAEMRSIKDEMDHDWLVARIQDRDIPASRRRLYFSMLSLCGSEADVPMLEAMMRSDDRQQKSGLDALIGCFLMLGGAEGMNLVEDLFLKNKKAEYADTNSAVIALRVLADEGDILPIERILEGLRHMLERKDLADLVIPDLAKWKDWSAMPRLVKLFKDADATTSWVRVPVVNYLRACPDPKAKEYIAELEKIDPEAVKRARTFFPVGTIPGNDKTSEASSATIDNNLIAPTIDVEDAAEITPAVQSAATSPPEEVKSNRWLLIFVIIGCNVILLIVVAAKRILQGGGSPARS